MAKPIHILNGPNLNLLGTREPEIYGSNSLQDIENHLKQRFGDTEMVLRQSNHEGELVDWIQDASQTASAIILNAGAYTHTSIAIHDALRACKCPIIEVHLSNPAARETFRHQSFVGSVATGTIAGFGAHGYDLAVQSALHLIDKESEGA
ncbi:MAG: type II 3-dehydroquinate dehydratase [Pseudomonadota bacterium]